jgi:hypothetical protein
VARGSAPTAVAVILIPFYDRGVPVQYGIMCYAGAVCSLQVPGAATVNGPRPIIIYGIIELA